MTGDETASGLVPAGRPRVGDTLHVATRPPSFTVIGAEVAAITFDEALDYLLEAAKTGHGAAVHFCTSHTLVEAHEHPALARALAAAELLAPDGMPLVWIGRLQGERVERVCGPDAMPAIIDRGRAQGARHFFYGGAPGTAQALAARITERYPGVIVAGTHTPPFRPLTPAEDAQELELIAAAQPHFVWVGLGTPKQDLWIAQHRQRLPAAVLLGVGAAFDYHSGNLRRAPRWMRRTGSEWLFRLAAEPRRLARRYTVTNAKFIWLVLRDAVKRRRAAMRP